jgi:hypothetical protein
MQERQDIIRKDRVDNKILVVCSHKDGRDFNNPSNNDLKILFETEFENKPEYIFCFNLSDEKCNFPGGMGTRVDAKYDAIWFAGCNLLEQIFYNPLISIEVIKKVLKDDGFIVFTETKQFVDRYVMNKYHLTVPITSLGQHSTINKANTHQINNIIELCQQNFEETIINNHMVYKIKTVASTKEGSTVSSSLKTYDDLKNKYSQFDDDIIRQVFSSNKQDIASTDNVLKNMAGHPSDGELNLATDLVFNKSDNNLVDHSSRPSSIVEPPSQEVATCLAEKKSLFDYFTFPKKLKIKYVGPNNVSTDLPSTGFFGSMKGSTSTTDRIKGKESETDNVYTKVSKKFTNPITQVEIRDGQNTIVNPSDYVNATENWYFLVTLQGVPIPVAGGGRTRKRPNKKKGRRSSHKKRKMRIRGRRTKRPRRFSLTKRQKP